MCWLILVDDHNRIALNTTVDYVDFEGDYINASYIDVR